MPSANMKRRLSAAVLALCCLMAAISSFISVVSFLADTEGWGEVMFIVILAPAVAGGTLIFGVLPSAILFWKQGRNRLDRVSLWISGCTLAILVLTWLAVVARATVGVPF